MAAIKKGACVAVVAWQSISQGNITLRALTWVADLACVVWVDRKRGHAGVVDDAGIYGFGAAGSGAGLAGVFGAAITVGAVFGFTGRAGS